MRISVRARLLCVSLCLSFAFSPARTAAAPIVARVNDKPIYADELAREIEQNDAANGDGSRKEALNRLVLYHLAVEQARREGLDMKPEIKTSIDRLLYQSFLQKNAAEARKQIEPTDDDVAQRYAQEPLIHLRHLVLFARNLGEKKSSQRMVEILQEKMRKGADFKELILRYSQDESARTGGDLDFRGVHNFPAPFYPVVRKLNTGAVSAPLWSDDAVHLFQLAETKPLAAAPAPYLQHLRVRIRSEREDQFLTSVLQQLKKKAKIEILGAKEKS